MLVLSYMFSWKLNLSPVCKCFSSSGFCCDHCSLWLTSLPAPEDHLAYKSKICFFFTSNQSIFFFLFSLLNSVRCPFVSSGLLDTKGLINAEMVFPLPSLESRSFKLHSHCRWKQPKSDWNWHLDLKFLQAWFVTMWQKQSYQKYNYIT